MATASTPAHHKTQETPSPRALAWTVTDGGVVNTRAPIDVRPYRLLPSTLQTGNLARFG
ncbi:MAG: hypothetical protein L3J70_06675 [Gammaproteobacteria bacterium]|nr:hypothetical protein [Gammaproteobacteria bacterium]